MSHAARAQVRNRDLFDDAPGVHDADAVAQRGDDVDVVRDEEHRGPVVGVDLVQQTQHVGLHSDVEGRGRFVGDQQPRLGEQGHRDHGPLTHAAGQLVRVLVHSGLRRRNPDLPEPVDRQLGRGPARDVLVHPQHLGQLPADVQGGVEAAGRVLEHHADVGREPGGRRDVRAVEVGAVDPEPVGRPAQAGWEQARERHRGDALAGPRLADDPDDLACGDVEGHSAHQWRTVRGDLQFTHRGDELPAVVPNGGRHRLGGAAPGAREPGGGRGRPGCAAPSAGPARHRRGRRPGL